MNTIKYNKGWRLKTKNKGTCVSRTNKMELLFEAIRVRMSRFVVRGANKVFGARVCQLTAQHNVAISLSFNAA